MRKNLVGLFIWLLFTTSLIGQTGVLKDGFQIFYYPGGQKSSEGILRNGKPDGYWIAYFPSGIKKSEGNRKNFLLDSTWVFYNQLGDTTEKIEYLLGKKNGYTLRYGYRNDRIGKDRMVIIAKELFLNDKQEGNSYYFYPDGKLREIIKYKDGRKDGLAFEWSKDSVITAVLDYRKDYLVQSERVNRIDSTGVKQGLWREYYQDGRIKTEEYYKNGLLSGLYKRFNEKGSLELSLNYVNGRIDESKTALAKEVSIRNLYDENNILTFSGAYIDSVPVGIHRYYNSRGEVVSAKVYSNSGILLSDGIITNDGQRQGLTKFYFEDGKLYSKGEYVNNQKTGKWIYYFEDGKVEQEGYFKNDLADGLWKWYFHNGSSKRDEEFLNGKEDGNYVEYDNDENVITQGTYVEGEKEGEWTYKVGDHSEIGKYVSGLRDGLWKYYYGDGKLQFEGTFVQGNLNGWVKLYYNSGKLMEEQYYENGIKEKNWKKYDENGQIVLTVTYVEDIETRINGEKIQDSGRDVKLIK